MAFDYISWNLFQLFSDVTKIRYSLVAIKFVSDKLQNENVVTKS